MKLEITTNASGVCESFKIDGVEHGKGIYAYDIVHKAGDRPIVILHCEPKELIINYEDSDIYIAKKSLWKKIINKFKKEG